MPLATLGTLWQVDPLRNFFKEKVDILASCSSVAFSGVDILAYCLSVVFCQLVRIGSSLHTEVTRYYPDSNVPIFFQWPTIDQFPFHLHLLSNVFVHQESV